MKGFIKGFKYITQMFDEKEPEMEIGLPTDVKHVAHIGSEGPSATTPSWMKDFDSAPEVSNLNSGDVRIITAQETSQNLPPQPKATHKSRRKQAPASGSPCSSPTRKGSDGPKPSRRHRSSNSSMDSNAEGSSRRPRHPRNSEAGSESPSYDPANPKKSRRRRSKESSNEGSNRSKGSVAEQDIDGKSGDSQVLVCDGKD
ncbi:hypothetical protein ACFE04_015343 [Oxalis oulophora]